MFVLSVIIGIISRCWFKKRNKNDMVNNMYSSTAVHVHERVSYEELHNATGGFSVGNTIGSETLVLSIKHCSVLRTELLPSKC